MSRALAAPLYFALYFAFALLPLQAAMIADPHLIPRGFPVEFAVGIGFVAYSLILLELVLVTRLRTLSDAFGADTLLQFHRALAGVGAAFLLSHVLGLIMTSSAWSALNPLAGSAAMRTGAVAFWSMLLLLVSSRWRRQLRMSYDFWNRIHRLSSVVLLLSATAHVLLVSGYTAAPMVRNVVLALALMFAALMGNYTLLRPLRLWQRSWRVVRNESLGGDTRLLTVTPIGHPGFTFAPGQFSWLISGRSPYSRQQHPITIASSAESASSIGSQDYAIKKLGDWSRDVVPALTPGARIWVEGPYGALSADRLPGQGFVLIAGGIGITPMRAILLTLRDRRDRRPCVLFYAANDFSRVVFRNEFDDLCRYLDLKVVYVLEHPTGDYFGERGRIDRAMLDRHLPEPRRHFQYLICGPNPMMDSIESLLLDLGVPDDRVHSERFDQV
jgi:predicted ferric reductase